MRRISILLLTLTLLASCTSKNKDDVRFRRFEQLLFTTHADQLQAELKKHQDEYTTELIMLYPDEPGYIQMAQDYVADPTMREVYHITDSLYHDLSDIEHELSRALERARKLDPSIELPSRFYTMVTGDFDNYLFRVYSNLNELCISIDQYALGAMGRYQYFGIPNHIVRYCSREYIVPDCMNCIASLNCTWPDGENTLLDYAVAGGKVLYFLEKTLPHTPDTILLRYTSDQMKWMRNNSANVWGYLVQNGLLFNTDKTLFRNLIDDAPKTNAFGDGSAPRTVHYLGWQIVKAYMKRSGSTMQELFAETDSRKILNESHWRP